MKKKTCPNCGKEFDGTKHPLVKYCSPHCYYQHIRSSNNHAGEQKTCVVCGKQYVQKYPIQKTCSWKCGNSLKEQRGRKIKCIACGKEIKQKRYSTKYCSRECLFKSHRKVDKICISCGKEFRDYPSRENRKLCSRECQSRWMSASFSGENSWHWLGGEDKTFRDSQEYRRWRRAVLKRDDHTCQMCGDFYQDMQAHHIELAAEHPELRLVVENGITLCKDCHASIRGREKDFEQVFKSKIMRLT